MRNNPCEEHFYSPCITYKPTDKDYTSRRIEESKSYHKETCKICGWRIATTTPKKTDKKSFANFIDVKKLISR